MVIARAVTPGGRIVELRSSAWNHVLDGHPELIDSLAVTMRALSDPDFTEPDPRPGRQRFFALVRPGCWLRVVTEFAGDHDQVVTAFEQINDPRAGG